MDNQKPTHIHKLFVSILFYGIFFIGMLPFLSFFGCKTEEAKDKHSDFYTSLNEVSELIEYDIDSTFSILDSLLVVAMKQEDPLMIAWTHILFGQAYSYKDYIFIAIDYYKKAIQQLEEANDLELKAKILNNLAMNYVYNNQIVEAIEAFESMLEVSKLTNDEQVYHFGLMNLASQNTKLGLYDIASKQNEEALNYFQRENDSIEIALCFLNSSEIAQAKGDLETAIDLLIQVIQIYPDTETIDIWNYHLLLSRLYLESGQYDSALKYYSFLEELKPYFSTTYSDALKVELLGDYHQKLDNLAEAFANYEKAYDLYEQSESMEEQQNMLRKIIRMSLNTEYSYLAEKYYPIFDSLQTIELRQVSQQRADELSSILHMNLLSESLDEERLISKQRSTLILYMSMLLLILFIVIIIGILYQRKLKRLYRVLYDKNIETMSADNPVGIDAEGDYVEKISETDENNSNLLLSRFSKILVSKALYTDPNLTLKQAASMLGTNDRYLSFAINQGTNSNFNAYLNKHRIKVAQSMLLNPQFQHYTIEAIAEVVGFANRQTFFRVFKQVSGLNPTQFREFASRKESKLSTSVFTNKKVENPVL